MKAIAYYRVSSREQRQKKTISSQKRQVQMFAKQMDYTIVDEYEDDGLEGGTLERRKGFQSTLQAIEGGRAQVLLVTFINRIGRFKELRDRNRVVELFQGYQVNVHAAMLPPDGTLYRWDNEEDIETLRKELWHGRKDNIERGHMVRLGLNERRLRGAPVGKLPYGLLYDEETETYSYDLKKCDTLRTIIQLLTNGWGLPRVSKALNGDLDKYPPPGSKGEWATTSIHQIVHNDFYFTAAIHSTKPDVQPQPTRLEPLFTEEEVKNARREMSLRERRSGIVKRANHLLHGFLQCGECGYSMGPHPKKRVSGRITWYYRCRGKNQHGKDFCSQRLFRANELEEMVWQTVLKTVQNGEDLEKAILDEEFIPDADRDQLKDLAAGADRDLAKLEERLRKIKDLYEWGDDDEDTYNAKKDRIKKEQIEVEELLRKTVEQLERPAEKKAAIREAVLSVADEVNMVVLHEEWLRVSRKFRKLTEAEHERIEREEPDHPYVKFCRKIDEMISRPDDALDAKLYGQYALADSLTPRKKKELINEQKRGIFWSIIGSEGVISVMRYHNIVKISLEGYVWGKFGSSKMLKLKSLRTL